MGSQGVVKQAERQAAIHSKCNHPRRLIDYNIKSMALAVETKPVNTTRAVERMCMAGERRYCDSCGKNIGFEARKRNRQIIANIYVKIDSLGRKRPVQPGQCGGVWDHVEHWHPECYEAQGQPFGEPDLILPEYRNLSAKR